jgi:sulfonate transport system ATP-binding protein
MRPDPGRVAAILRVPEAASRHRSHPEFIGLRDEVQARLGVPPG